MTPLALAAGMGASMGGMLVDKRGPVLAVALAGIVAAVGFFLFPAWIDTKWQFIIGSIVAGGGMGILLGAPLNILATEKLQNNQGTALASLSLIRTIGMTIAPTIYADFIARGFNQIPDLFKTDFGPTLQENLKDADLSAAGAQEMQQLAGQFTSGGNLSTEEMQQLANNIQDPTLKEVVANTVAQITRTAAQDGYGGLFMSAAVISIGILLFAVILQPIRKKSLLK